MNKIIDVNKIFEDKKILFSNKIKEIPEKLKVVVIQVGNDFASSVYSKRKAKICNELGIDFEYLKFNQITENDLICRIEKLNNDSSVTGIFIELPLPYNMNEEKIIESISPSKDIDGLTRKNIGSLYVDDDAIVPCTALAVMEILSFIDEPLEGKNVCIVGRSKLIGIPLFSLFLKENTTVTMCHSKTRNLKDITSRADILIVAVGKHKFITNEFVKNDAIVIDVGINSVEGTLCGDVYFDDVSSKAKYITPVPGGVGIITVAMFVNNVIKAYEIAKN